MYHFIDIYRELHNPPPPPMKTSRINFTFTYINVYIRAHRSIYTTLTNLSTEKLCQRITWKFEEHWFRLQSSKLFPKMSIQFDSDVLPTFSRSAELSEVIWTTDPKRQTIVCWEVLLFVAWRRDSPFPPAVHPCCVTDLTHRILYDSCSRGVSFFSGWNLSGAGDTYHRAVGSSTRHSQTSWMSYAVGSQWWPASPVLSSWQDSVSNFALHSRYLEVEFLSFLLCSYAGIPFVTWCSIHRSMRTVSS